MSSLHIQHRTTYHYTAPVKFGIHRLVLRPREGHRTTVTHHNLILQPEARLTWMTDVNGNHVAYAEFPYPAEKLVITNEVTLELMDDPDNPLPPARHSEAALPLTYLQTEERLAAAYAFPVYEEEAREISDWVKSLPEFHFTRSALETAQWLNTEVHRHIGYRRREEPGVQSPATTLRLGTGSCRDLATLCMEAARSLGMPARFVSGYLDSAISAAGRGSTHAWMEVYLPDGGWRGFDPTSGRCTSPRHIPTGVSSHPRGVMPISGTYDSSTGSSLGMKVELTIRHDTSFSDRAASTYS